MSFSSLRESPLVIALLCRAVLLAGSTSLLIHLLANTHLYATALVVFCLIILLIADLNRVVIHADRLIDRFLDALSAGTVETSGEAVALGTLASPFQRAMNLLQTRRIEQERHREYLQTLLDTVSASLIVVREDRSIMLANRAAQRLGRHPASRLEDVHAIGINAAVTLSTLAPGAHQVVRLENGVHVLASIAQITIPGGESQQLIALQRLVGELDAVEIKAWDDMARVLSHEIMNSLTPIASLSENLGQLLHSGNHTEDVAASLEAIRRRSFGLMSFVERYRKVTELPQPLMQTVNLQELIGTIEHLMTTIFSNRRIEYVSSFTPSNIFVNADPQLLEQALINLLKNAVDAVSVVNVPRIQVSCRLENERVVIDIADNGIGLSQEQKEHLFVPFYTTKVGGSGIGVNLVRRIALAHEGHLTIAPNEPTGSIFTLTLNISYELA